MAGLLTKQLETLTAADVDEFCRLKVAESETVELKGPVPHKKGEPWSATNPQLSDYAKRELVRQVVGLANSHGGHLVIGIAETDEDPPKADKPAPIEAAGDLATRLEDVLRNTIEPALMPLEVVPVSYPEGEKSGIVVVRVNHSRLRPHRSCLDRHVWVRMGRSCVNLSMLDIQDRVVEARTRTQSISQQLEARRLPTDAPDLRDVKATVAVRVTALPTEALTLPRRPYEYTVDDLRPLGALSLVIDGASARWRLRENVQPDQRFQPRLRGATREYLSNHPILKDEVFTPHHIYSALSEEIGTDGSAQIVYRHSSERGELDEVNENLVALLVAHTITTVGTLRRDAGTPSAEYVIQVEVKCWPPEQKYSHKGVGSQRILGTFDQSFILPETLFVGSNLMEPLRTVYDDLRNVMGDYHTNELRVPDWEG